MPTCIPISENSRTHEFNLEIDNNCQEVDSRLCACASATATSWLKQKDVEVLHHAQIFCQGLPLVFKAYWWKKCTSIVHMFTKKRLTCKHRQPNHQFPIQNIHVLHRQWLENSTCGGILWEKKSGWCGKNTCKSNFVLSVIWNYHLLPNKTSSKILIYTNVEGLANHHAGRAWPVHRLYLHVIHITVDQRFQCNLIFLLEDPFPNINKKINIDPLL